MVTKIPVIIDTDPGIDDAIAIAMAIADDRLDIRLFTTVGGNVGLDKTTANMLKLVEFFGLDVPVARGSARPLIREPQEASNVHGDSGMDGYDFAEPDPARLAADHAVLAMHRVIRESTSPLTLVGLGPLTNFALLLRLFPEDAANIERIVFMGGSTQRGNKGVLAEYNVYCDPEAADIVLRSGLSIAMVPLDVGWKALVMPEQSAQIAQLGRTGEMVHGLLSRYRGGGLTTGLKMYDGTAIACLLEPGMFTIEHVPVVVELQGSMTAGATLVDLRGYLGIAPNADVAVDIDAEAFSAFLLQQLKRCDQGK